VKVDELRERTTRDEEERVIEAKKLTALVRVTFMALVDLRLPPI
jgi:hypothetical protein